ncbi:hypothetical protein ACFQXB_11865 [Plastorhodobacter daqingensis]|uniref:Transposase IS30-like HTH domain-containing protein n=1 Tax=Plastorhodobacter daqingensis TaxID=1387281 RepID=A0ABW2UJK1_9RHOB
MKLGADEMAHRLGRHRTSISCELRPNHFHDGAIPKPGSWCCVVAPSHADGRRRRQRKLLRDPVFCGPGRAPSEVRPDPEQNADQMRYQNAPHRVCRETIYRRIYSEDRRRSELFRRDPLRKHP